MRTLVKEIKGGESWGLIDHDGGVVEEYSKRVAVQRFCSAQTNVWFYLIKEDLRCVCAPVCKCVPHNKIRT